MRGELYWFNILHQRIEDDFPTLFSCGQFLSQIYIKANGTRTCRLPKSRKKAEQDSNPRSPAYRAGATTCS